MRAHCTQFEVDISKIHAGITFHKLKTINFHVFLLIFHDYPTLNCVRVRCSKNCSPLFLVIFRILCENLTYKHALKRLYPKLECLDLSDLLTSDDPIQTCGQKTLNPRPAGGGPKGPPSGFSQIAPEVLGISL